MNCFEARKEFTAFWRRTMAPEQRAAFVTHLQGCARCDSFFRVFALSAPVIHADTARHGGIQNTASAHPSGAFARPNGAASKRATISARSWAAAGAVFALAAAAMVALYVATAPRHQTLDEVLADDNSAVELVSYESGGSGVAQDSATADPFSDDFSASPQDDLAR